LIILSFFLSLQQIVFFLTLLQRPQNLRKSHTDQPKETLIKLQKICYRIVASLQKTNNVKLCHATKRLFVPSKK